jgi:ABC-type sugar transport system substrate-binding protein
MKKSKVILVLCLIVSLFAACRGSKGSETVRNAGKSENTKKVVLLVKKLSSTFWVDMEKGVQDQCAQYAWVEETLSPIKADNNEEQIQLLEQSLLNPPDVYLIAPGDSKGIAPAVEQINAAGIPIINYNTRIIGEGLKVVTFVGVDNYSLAKQSAQALVEKMNGKGKLLFLEGSIGNQNAIDIKNGAMEVLKAVDGIEVLDSQTANFLRTDAQSVTQNLFQKYPHVDAIFASNGETAMGAVEAVRQSGRAGIMIATINMSDEMAKAIQSGSITLTIDDAPYMNGLRAVQAAYDYFAGTELPENIILDGILVDKDNLVPYVEKYGL